MRIGKVHSWKKVIAQIVLLALPTIAIAYLMLAAVNKANAILQNNALQQTGYFAGGMVLAIVFYSFRFRFITTAATLALLGYIVYKTTGAITVGEFDAFFASVTFGVLSILFTLGWLVGYGLSRSRIFCIAWPITLIALGITALSHTQYVTLGSLLLIFTLTIAYGLYIIYTSELIRNINNDEKYFTWFVFKRIAGFDAILAVLVIAMLLFFNKDFKAIEHEYGDAQGQYDKDKGNSESMTKNNKDGSISNKDQTKLTGSLSKDQRLVFVAKLDSYFPDGKTPNPLYFTAYYFTKFDTTTQTFERDPGMPDNDLFTPNPSKIPLYFAKTDSTVIKNTHASVGRKVISADIYKVYMSPDDYVAPSTSFFCQPIPVPNEYKSQYRSAYRAKMYVSELNSAYFIYNPAGNKQIEDFQKTRFDVLRTVNDFTALDRKFYDYYTFMPKDKEYDKIKELAAKIGAEAKTPADKMLAIRNYFLSKDEFGQPMYKYSDNPGIPGLPSANKLTYFLFENRKGYCAYFAGATLFLLRAMGIPSRVAVGYLTVDRSSKNPGWYWFYEKQAHAWVQAYFPGYGWIDFDTTVPSTDQQESPQPDQTPPLNMQQAYFVADGTVTDIDTVKKRMGMDVTKIIFHDKDYDTKTTQHINTDVSLATVSTDTGAVSLGYIKQGMHVTAASYAEALKNITAGDNDDMAAVLSKIPKVVPVDEIKVLEPESVAKQKAKEAAKQSTPVNWTNVLIWSLAFLLCVVLVIFELPSYIYWIYRSSANSEKDARKKAWKTYRAAMYYLNQLGYYRTNMGPQQYARMIDENFGTAFEKFSNVYQKVKYSSVPLTENEQQQVAEFYKTFVTQVRSKVPLKIRTSKFLNIYNTIHFFTQPKIS